MPTSHDAPIAPQAATPEDVAAIHALYLAGGWRPQSRSWQALEARIGRGEVALVRDEGRVVASVTLTWEDTECWGEVGLDGTAGYVHALVRDREQSASGIGGRLLGWAEAHIAARGRMLSRLDTRAESPGLHRYYAEHGYRPVGSVTVPGHSALTLFEKDL